MLKIPDIVDILKPNDFDKNELKKINPIIPLKFFTLGFIIHVINNIPGTPSQELKTMGNILITASLSSALVQMPKLNKLVANKSNAINSMCNNEDGLFMNIQQATQLIAHINDLPSIGRRISDMYSSQKLKEFVHGEVDSFEAVKDPHADINIDKMGIKTQLTTEDLKVLSLEEKIKMKTVEHSFAFLLKGLQIAHKVTVALAWLYHYRKEKQKALLSAEHYKKAVNDLDQAIYASRVSEYGVLRANVEKAKIEQKKAEMMWKATGAQSVGFIFAASTISFAAVSAPALAIASAFACAYISVANKNKMAKIKNATSMDDLEGLRLKENTASMKEGVTAFVSNKALVVKNMVGGLARLCMSLVNKKVTSQPAVQNKKEESDFEVLDHLGQSGSLMKGGDKPEIAHEWKKGDDILHEKLEQLASKDMNFGM